MLCASKEDEKNIHKIIEQLVPRKSKKKLLSILLYCLII